MQFDTSLRDTEAADIMQRFISITGSEPWLRKFNALSLQLKGNPFLQDWQATHNAIEWKVNDLALQHEREGFRLGQVQDETHYELLGFASGVVRIYDRLSPVGKNRLKGMLLDGLRPDHSLLSLQHEVVTAVHLMRRGFDVEMNDLECGSGIDFIARKDDFELEVECKLFTADLGRKIHRRKVLALHKHLAGAIASVYESARIGKLVLVSIPDRLHSTAEQIQGIVDAVAAALNSPKSQSVSKYCEVGVYDFDVAASPFNADPSQLTRDAISEFTFTQLGRENKESLMLFAPGKRAVVLLVESALPDQVLKGIYRQLRESAMKQFTLTRPGVLAVQFHDLSADDISELGRADTKDRENATGLQLMTSHFLNSPNRGHIHTVAYRSHGNIVESNEENGDKAYQGQGSVYFITNPLNNSFNDPRSRVFG